MSIAMMFIFDCEFHFPFVVFYFIHLSTQISLYFRPRFHLPVYFLCYLLLQYYQIKMVGLQNCYHHEHSIMPDQVQFNHFIVLISMIKFAVNLNLLDFHLQYKLLIFSSLFNLRKSNQLHFNADDHYFVHFHFIYPHFTFILSSTILVFILV